jgi:hypothetical protein
MEEALVAAKVVDGEQVMQATMLAAKAVTQEALVVAKRHTKTRALTLVMEKHALATPKLPTVAAGKPPRKVLTVKASVVAIAKPATKVVTPEVEAHVPVWLYLAIRQAIVVPNMQKLPKTALKSAKPTPSSKVEEVPLHVQCTWEAPQKLA